MSGASVRLFINVSRSAKAAVSSFVIATICDCIVVVTTVRVQEAFQKRVAVQPVTRFVSKEPFLHLHSDTHGGVLHSAHPLHGPRRPPESRPPPPPPHRRFVQRGRHAPGRSSLMWPPFGSAPLTSGQVAEAVSWLHRQAHELLTLAARVRLRCGHCRDFTQSPHVPIFDGLPPLTGVLIRHSLSTGFSCKLTRLYTRL